MSVSCAPFMGKFARIVMPDNFPIDSDDAAPYMVHAVEIADGCGKPVHVQNPKEITVYIATPEI